MCTWKYGCLLTHCWCRYRRGDVAAAARAAATIQKLCLAQRGRSRQGSAATALHALRRRRAQVPPHFHFRLLANILTVSVRKAQWRAF